MKKLFLKLLSFFLRAKNKSLPEHKELINTLERNPKILIVRQHNQLGDMILSNSLFRALKECVQGCYVTVIASEENYQAIVSNKYIDNLVVLWKKKLWNPIDLIRFITKLRQSKYSLAIVPATVSISFTSCLIARLSGAQFTIGPASLYSKANKYSFLFDYKIDVGVSPDKKRHISDIILDIVRPFGISTDDLTEHILINNEEKNFAKNFFNNVNEIKVGLHIGAGKVPNRWNVNNFAEVIKYLKKNFDAFIYLTIGHWDEELLSILLQKIDFEPKVLRNLPIPKLAAIIEQSDLFISNDTGILHVAGSTTTPVIGLFGPTDPEVWAPKGDYKFYLRKGNDINLIKVEDVTRLIDKILSNSREKLKDAIKKNSSN